MKILGTRHVRRPHLNISHPGSTLGPHFVETQSILLCRLFEAIAKASGSRKEHWRISNQGFAWFKMRSLGERLNTLRRVSQLCTMTWK